MKKFLKVVLCTIGVGLSINSISILATDINSEKKSLIGKENSEERQEVADKEVEEAETDNDLDESEGKMEDEDEREGTEESDWKFDYGEKESNEEEEGSGEKTQDEDEEEWEGTEESDWKFDYGEKESNEEEEGSGEKTQDEDEEEWEGTEESDWNFNYGHKESSEEAEENIENKEAGEAETENELNESEEKMEAEDEWEETEESEDEERNRFRAGLEQYFKGLGIDNVDDCAYAVEIYEKYIEAGKSDSFAKKIAYCVVFNKKSERIAYIMAERYVKCLEGNKKRKVKAEKLYNALLKKVNGLEKQLNKKGVSDEYKEAYVYCYLIGNEKIDLPDGNIIELPIFFDKVLEAYEKKYEETGSSDEAAVSATREREKIEQFVKKEYGDAFSYSFDLFKSYIKVSLTIKGSRKMCKEIIFNITTDDDIEEAVNKIEKKYKISEKSELYSRMCAIYEKIHKEHKIVAEIMAGAYMEKFKETSDEFKAEEYAELISQELEILCKDIVGLPLTYKKIDDLKIYLKAYCRYRILDNKKRVIANKMAIAYKEKYIETGDPNEANRYALGEKERLKEIIVEKEEQYTGIDGRLFIYCYAKYIADYGCNEKAAKLIAEEYVKKFKETHNLEDAKESADNARKRINWSLNEFIKKYKSLGKSRIYTEAYFNYYILDREQSEIAHKMAEVYEKRYNSGCSPDEANKYAIEERNKLEKEIKKVKMKCEESGESEAFSRMYAIYSVVCKEPEGIARRMAKAYEKKFKKSQDNFEANKEARLKKEEINKKLTNIAKIEEEEKYKSKAYAKAYSRYFAIDEEREQMLLEMANAYEEEYKRSKSDDLANTSAMKKRDELKKKMIEVENKYIRLNKSIIFANACARYIVLYKQPEKIAKEMAKVYEDCSNRYDIASDAELHSLDIKHKLEESLRSIKEKYKGKSDEYIDVYFDYHILYGEESAIAEEMAQAYEDEYNMSHDRNKAKRCAIERRRDIIKKIDPIRGKYITSGKSEGFSYMCAIYIVLNNKPEKIAEKMAEAYERNIKDTCNVERAKKYVKIVENSLENKKCIKPDLRVWMFSQEEKDIEREKIKAYLKIVPKIKDRSMLRLRSEQKVIQLKEKLAKIREKYMKLGKSGNFSYMYARYTVLDKEPMRMAKKMAEAFEYKFDETKNIIVSSEYALKIKEKIEDRILKAEKICKDESLKYKKAFTNYYAFEQESCEMAKSMARAYEEEYKKSRNHDKAKEYAEMIGDELKRLMIRKRNELMEPIEEIRREYIDSGKGETFSYICARYIVDDGESKKMAEEMAKAYEENLNKTQDILEASRCAQEKKRRIVESLKSIRENYKERSLAYMDAYSKYHLIDGEPSEIAEKMADVYEKEYKKTDNHDISNKCAMEKKKEIKDKFEKVRRKYLEMGKSTMFSYKCAGYIVLNGEFQDIAEEMAEFYERNFKKNHQEKVSDENLQRMREKMDELLNPVKEKYKSRGERYAKAYFSYHVLKGERSEIAEKMADVYDRTYIEENNHDIASKCAMRERIEIKRRIEKIKNKYMKLNKSEIFSRMVALYMVVYGERECIAIRMAEAYEREFRKACDADKAERRAQLEMRKMKKMLSSIKKKHEKKSKEYIDSYFNYICTGEQKDIAKTMAKVYEDEYKQVKKPFVANQSAMIIRDCLKEEILEIRKKCINLGKSDTFSYMYAICRVIYELSENMSQKLAEAYEQEYSRTFNDDKARNYMLKVHGKLAEQLEMAIKKCQCEGKSENYIKAYIAYLVFEGTSEEMADKMARIHENMK